MTAFGKAALFAERMGITIDPNHPDYSPTEEEIIQGYTTNQGPLGVLNCPAYDFDRTTTTKRTPPPPKRRFPVPSNK